MGSAHTHQPLPAPIGYLSIPSREHPFLHELADDAVTLQQLQQARTARRKQLKQQLRERRSLADALPADQRHLPLPPDGLEPTDRPQAAEKTAVAPAHRLRTYAAD